MGHRIIFATGNEGKMREIRVLLADLGLPVLSMKEAGVNPVIVEDGADFGENAEICLLYTSKSVQTLFGFIKFRPAQDDNGS